jgi:hypothetical protein
MASATFHRAVESKITGMGFVEAPDATGLAGKAFIHPDDEPSMTLSAGGESATTSLNGLRRATRELQIARIAAPGPIAFGEEQFMPAPELVALAETLRERHEMPTEISLDVLWKREGGAANGRPCWAKMTRTHTGLIGFLSAVDVVIWVAADHLANLIEPERAPEIAEAILFSQLCRVDADEKLRPVIKPLDFVGMTAELEHYGLWRQELRAAAESFEQAQLFA